ncbi:MAG TPA: hypothetical protein ENK13_00910 [Thermopetrobacter sp.]|nr:hypothetical protein [Thermopetrobacter sp.]
MEEPTAGKPAAEEKPPVPEKPPAEEKPPAADTGTPAEAAPPAAAGEELLYVVKETVIRGRPARILSDGTIEAELELEGWLRFEDENHLNEYLDALEEMLRQQKGG